jgi:glycosyltransferase involved in cell wall biosynthesis
MASRDLSRFAPGGALKVLHIIASADPRSGGPIEGILRQEAALGEHSTSNVVTLDPPDAAFLDDIRVPILAFGRRGRSYRGKFIPLKYGFSISYVLWILRNAKAYDAVIVHGLWNFSTFAASITLPFMKSVRYFVYAHGMMDPWFRGEYPIKHLFKIASWLLCEGRLLSAAKSVLFTADDERDLARGQFPGWRYAETVVGYGTATPPKLSPPQGKAFADSAPGLSGRRYLLFLSRIHPKKGCDLLVEAFAASAERDPGLDLVVVGPDDTGMIPALKARAEMLGVGQRIHWPGMLTGDAKWGAYRGAEAFILPSHQENFGVVVAEALACGLPVLTTRKVNIWREVHNAGAGCVESDDLDGVKNLIAFWLNADAAQRKTMCERAEALFLEKFDVDFVARRLATVIRENDPPSSLAA